MTPTLTIVVPTIGRPGLQRTLNSIEQQALIPGDRVLVVYDSYDRQPGHDVQALVACYGARFEYLEHDAGEHWYGIAQLNHAMAQRQTTDFLCALGDDDVYVKDAFKRLRPRLEPGRCALFRFRSPWGEVLWDAPVLRRTHISGCCLVAPTAHLQPLSTRHYVESDFDWIESTIEATGEPPVWVDDCLIVARPDRQVAA